MDKKSGKWLTARLEDRLKAWLVPKVPTWLETYHLTLTTVLWCLLVIVFSFLARYNIQWLWLASLAIVMQYITDLLDGAVGRERDTGLVKWGYYMDHMLDYMFLCSMLIGYTCLVPRQYQYILFYILAFFGAFMVNSFLSFGATSKFRMSYLGIGPTEVRLVFITVNTALILSGPEYLVKALPWVLLCSSLGFFVTVYRTQREIWDMDMARKSGAERVEPEEAGTQRAVGGTVGWPKMIRNIGFSYFLAIAAFAVLMTKSGAPYHRLIAALIYFASWVPFVLSFTEKRAFLRKQKTWAKRVVRPYLPHIVLFVLLIVLARWVWVLTPIEDTVLTQLSDRELDEHIETDMQSIEILRETMEGLLEWAASSGVLEKSGEEIGANDRDQLREFWHTFLETSTEFSILSGKYKGFYQIDYVARPRAHAEAFLIAYVAFVEHYHSLVRVVNLVGDNALLVTVLDEANPAGGVPGNSFTDVKARLVHPNHLLRLNAGIVYLPNVRRNLEGRADVVNRVRKQVENTYRLLGKSPAMLASGPLEFFEKRAFSVWLPFQKAVALQMSSIRTVQRDYLVDVAAINEHRARLEPGDILLERRNWHMTNIGIPGFWPHAALYVGTLAEMEEYFGGMEILGGGTVAGYLREACPDVLRNLLTLDEYGFERSVIESVRPGVVLTSVEHSGHADYLAALRPMVSREAKWQALCSAFSYFGRPYDFNFDFMTDSALVCSELVYKAYQGVEGIDLEPKMVNGRLLLPPNSMAGKFDREYGTDRQQLGFVLFLDGSEEKRTVVSRSAADLRASWQRPKWDIMQE